MRSVNEMPACFIAGPEMPQQIIDALARNLVEGGAAGRILSARADRRGGDKEQEKPACGIHGNGREEVISKFNQAHGCANGLFQARQI